MSYQDDYWMVFDIEALNELSTANFIIDSHTSKTFNLTGTIETTHSSVTNWYIYFNKMNVYRVID